MSINTERESNDYFSHNPNENVVGFALLTAEQLQQAKNGEEITDNVDVLEVVVNDEVKYNLKKEYGQHASK